MPDCPWVQWRESAFKPPCQTLERLILAQVGMTLRYFWRGDTSGHCTSRCTTDGQGRARALQRHRRLEIASMIGIATSCQPPSTQDRCSSVAANPCRASSHPIAPIPLPQASQDMAADCRPPGASLSHRLQQFADSEDAGISDAPYLDQCF